MTPFFRLRPSSDEKEGKSASMTDCFKRKVRRANPHPSPVLDYWQLGIFSLVPFCSAKNPLVSNSFAGRARSSALQTRLRTCQNPRLGFTSRSQSFAFCAALPSCSFTDYSALYAPDVRYKILWIFVTHYGARDVTGSLAFWARLRPTENPARYPGWAHFVHTAPVRVTIYRPLRICQLSV